MRAEALVVTSQNRMPTQTSCPLYEQHLNIVTAGIAKLDDALLGIALLALRLKGKVRFSPWNFAATKTLLGQWRCVGVFLGLYQCQQAGVQ